jgi:hypothetical protein
LEKRPRLARGLFLFRAKFEAAVGIWLFARSVAACPVCHSPAGARVRAGIFNPEFSENLFAAFLPFAVFAVIVAFLHFGLPTGRRSITHVQDSER